MVIATWRKLALFDAREGVMQAYRDLYSLRTRRRFDVIDRILAALDVNEFPEAFLVGILTVTAAAARELAEREDFFQRVRARLAASRGVEAADRALLGLACSEGWAPMKEDNQ